MRIAGWMVVLAATAATGGCGGGADGGQRVADVPPPVEVSIAGRAVVKVRTASGGWAALVEKLRPVENVTQPDRRLQIASAGRTAGVTYVPPSGWLLIDFALHPSRQISVVLANARELRLLRIDREGRVLTEFDFVDPLAADDPFMDDPIYLRDPTAMVPFNTRDAARVAAIGEDVAMAIRTGRNAVVAYRYRYTANGFDRVWRTLVEPGVVIGNSGIIGGGFDPFGGLDNQWRLVMDASADGRLAVAVNVALTMAVEGHALHFNEPLADVPHGALVTAIDADGRRLSTTAVRTERKSEVHAVRWNGDRIAVAGRVYSQPLEDGSGWDGFVGVVAPARREVVAYSRVDVDRSDVILDLAALPDGRLLAAGSTGYVQNPAGGSISEGAQPLLAVLQADGRFNRRVHVAAGLRHNQVRSLAPWQARWLAGGMLNGPGTHSGDGDAALLFADGFVRESFLATP